jgi:rubrerythrin
MKSEKDLAHMIRVQIKMERKTARKIRELEDVVANLAAKLFLAEMRFDTEKHAKILRTMLDLMKKLAPDRFPTKFWNKETHEYVDALVAKRTLENHVKVETKMLKHVKEQIRKTDDEALKLLFRHIAADERKHHKIMGTILEKAFKRVGIP